MQGIIEKIKERVTTEEVLESYNVYPKKGTNIYRCFAHNDHKPSAHIDKRNGNFYCFVCHAYFDPIDVVMYFEKCNYKTALKIIDKKFELGLMEPPTKEERLEMQKREYLREKRAKNKILWQNFEKKACQMIIDKLHFWEIVQNETHPTKKEIKNDTWELDELFFLALKEQERLETLYYIIAQLPHEYNTWDALYGDNKKKIFRRMNCGEIKI